MNNHKIIFNDIDWTNAGVGVRYKAYINSGKRLRLVEFSEGFIELDWCTHGHSGIVLEGSFAIDYNGNIERYSKDDVIFIPNGEDDRHKAIINKGEKVMLLLFELLEG